MKTNLEAVVGRKVAALVSFEDIDSDGKAYFHALPGELGTIVEVTDELTYVATWDRTGTSCDVAHAEAQILSRKVVPRG